MREGFADSDLSRHPLTSIRVTERRVASVGAVREADRPGTRSGSSEPEYLFTELRFGCVRVERREEARGAGLFSPPPVPGMKGMDQNADVAGMRCVQAANPGRKTRARGPADGLKRV